MTTRIDGLNPLSTSRTLHGQGAAGIDGASGDRHSGPEAASGRQDNVTLSYRGRVVAEAAQAVMAARDVRTERVAAVKAAIADGTYRSDSRAIAARLLASGSFDVE